MLEKPSNNIDFLPKKKVPWPVLFGVGIIVLTVLIYIPDINKALGPFWVLTIYDVCVIAPSIAAALLATLVWRSFERGEMLSVIWGNVSVGLILWTAGDIIWSSDQLWGGNSLPYPSMADILWILGYLPVILAFGLRLYTLKIVPNKGWQFAALGFYILIF